MRRGTTRKLKGEFCFKNRHLWDILRTSDSLASAIWVCYSSNLEHKSNSQRTHHILLTHNNRQFRRAEGSTNEKRLDWTGLGYHIQFIHVRNHAVFAIFFSLFCSLKRSKSFLVGLFLFFPASSPAPASLELFPIKLPPRCANSSSQALTSK